MIFSDLKEYIVTVKNFEDINSLYDDMQSPDGNLYIPNRRIEIVELRPMSPSTHFMLSDEEADQVRKDWRVLSVELPYWARGIVIVPLETKKQYSDNWGKFSFLNNSLIKNWGLLRCFDGIQDPSWFDKSKSGAIALKNTGKDVDVVICDGTLLLDHPEFAVNPDGTGGSRVIRYNWFQHDNEVTGGKLNGASYSYAQTSDSYHGTHVTGIACGNTHGWARSANIYNISTTSQTPSLNWIYYMIDYIRAFHKNKPVNPSTGRKNPTIVNHSWGSTQSITISNLLKSTVMYRGTEYPIQNLDVATNMFGVLPGGQDGLSSTWTMAVRDLSIESSIIASMTEGVMHVSAAGNYTGCNDLPDSIDYNNYVNFLGKRFYYMQGSTPSSCPGVIEVGAMDDQVDGRKAKFSNSGPRTDVYAPGVNITSSISQNKQTQQKPDPRNSGYYIASVSGTSMACPQVTGILACVLESNPTFNQISLRNYLTSICLPQMNDSLYSVFSLKGSTNKLIKYPDEFCDFEESETLNYQSNDSLKNLDFKKWGEQIFTEDGVWTCPDGVTSMSIVSVGAGAPGNQYGGGSSGVLSFENNIKVTPGVTYTVKISKAPTTNVPGTQYYSSANMISGPNQWDRWGMASSGTMATGQIVNHQLVYYTDNSMNIIASLPIKIYAPASSTPTAPRKPGGWTYSGATNPSGGGGAGGYSNLLTTDRMTLGITNGQGQISTGKIQGPLTISYYNKSLGTSWKEDVAEFEITLDIINKIVRPSDTLNEIPRGGGAGGGVSTNGIKYSGGGVGLYGMGESGSELGEPGSGGSGSNYGAGGTYGGPPPGSGAIRIVWPGDVRKFPSDFVAKTPDARILSNRNTIGSGDTIIFNVSTEGFVDGAVLFWRITDKTGNSSTVQFSDNNIKGYKKIISNSAIIEKTLPSSFKTEETINLVFELLKFPTEISLSKLDFSISPNPPTVSITSDKNSSAALLEGEKINFVISLDGPYLPVLYWENLGSTTSKDFIENVNSGTLNVQSNKKASLSLTLKNDLRTETEETIQIQIRDGGPTGNILDMKSEIYRVIDSSKDLPETFSITITGSNFNETTNNIVNVNIIYSNIKTNSVYYLVPEAGPGKASSDDFVEAPAQINFNSSTPGFNIQSENCTGSMTISMTIKADQLTENVETLSFRLLKGSATGPIVAISSNSSNSSNSSIVDTSKSPSTYTITPDTQSVNEGGTVRYTITTTNVPNNTLLYWLNKGTTISGDFIDSINSSTVKIINNTGTISRVLKNDISSNEGDETIILELRTDAYSGPVVATSPTVTISDTSKAPKRYTIIPSVTKINEGQTVTYIITTTSVPDDTVLYWTNKGTTTANDFVGGANSGTVTIVKSTATLQLALVEDLSANEGDETIILELRTDSITGPIVTTAQKVTVIDSSKSPPTYTITPDTQSVNEGGTVRYTITTTNVPNNTVLYWTNKGTTTLKDFLDSQNSGMIKINNSTSSLIGKLSTDISSNEGDETIILELRTTSITGPVVATAASVTVNDTSVAPITYKIAAKSLKASEGQTVTYTITTTSVPDNTVLYWTNTGTTTANDFVGGVNSGPVTILNSTATLQLALVEDLSANEGDETIILELRTDSITGPIMATAASVTVTDSSKSPPTYTITPDTQSVNEGGTVRYTITTTNVPNNTNIFWTNKGTTISGDFIDSINSSTVKIINNTGTISRVLKNDISSNEGDETIILELRTTSITGPVVATAASVTVNDTSVAPITYKIAAKSLRASEGQTVTYTITTTSVPDNTVLYWTNKGTTTADDFVGGANSGTVTIVKSTGTINITVLKDIVVDKNETIVIELRTESESGPVVATALAVTVS